MEGEGGKWRAYLLREGSEGREGKREREGPPVITVSPGSRGARIVTGLCMIMVSY